MTARFGGTMSQPRDDRQDDLFRSSLEAIINLRHPLVRLAAEINWDFLAKRFSSVCRLGPGQPPQGLAARFGDRHLSP
jgi:transposase, IS5 family